MWHRLSRLAGGSFLSLTRFGALMALALACAAPVRAQDIYKCLDDRGRPLYTSDKRDTAGKKCETVKSEVNVAPAEKARSRSPASFPKEDRAAAKTSQRSTLERELTQEEAMLADAKKKLAEQESIRSGDEKNYAKVLDRLKPFQDTVEVHQKNVEALKRELNNLGR
jgi:septal ring factor EnvC (AmiA/AmiB activator)